MKAFPVGKDATQIRSELIANYHNQYSYIPQNVTVAVINVTDVCDEKCPHCMYSAPIRARREKLTGIKPAQISESNANKIGKILSESSIKQIVFSGGGEPTLNLTALSDILYKAISCESVVIVTSGSFFNDKRYKHLINILEIFINNGVNRKIILRFSVDSEHSISPYTMAKGILDISNNIVLKNNVKIVIRTLFFDKSEKINFLAKQLKGKIVPILSNIPVIDGFPTRWIVSKNYQIPIIYKPIYNSGQGSKLNFPSSDYTSWKAIKKNEEANNTFFNLSLRGKNGEGHNHYQTIIRGYDYWLKKGMPPVYKEGCTQEEKGLCVYIPSDERLLINAASPDSWLHVSNIERWDRYLSYLNSDPLQLAAISNPTDYLVNNAHLVGIYPENIADKTNFVFTLSQAALKTPSLRLYQTLRFIADEKCKSLKKYWGYNVESITEAILNDSPYPSLDPIMGNEPSVWELEKI